MAFKTPCLFCTDKPHTLFVCRTILKKDLKDRYQFLRSKGLCFGCLKAGHQKRECQHKVVCTHCGKTHPSILHVEPREHQGETSNTVESVTNEVPVNATSSATYTHMGAGDSTSLSQALPIVPVRLKSVDSDKYLETYAFLDSGSTSTFCSADIMRHLNIEGKRTKINLLTMGQEKVVDSFIVT